MIVTGATTAGGGEKQALELAEGLIGRGHQVMFVAPGGGDVLEAARARGCETTEVATFSPLASVTRRNLARLIVEWKPDIVHAHGPRAAFALRRLDADVTKRLVYTIHGIHAGHGPLGSVKLAVERHDVTKVAAFIVTCKADLETGADLGFLDRGKTQVIYNGLADPHLADLGVFRAENGIAPDTVLIAHVGRISPPKDHPTLLAAFDEAWRRCSAPSKPHLVMVAAGTYGQRERLLRAIRAMSSAHDITVLAALDDLAPLYTDADILVLSSKWEARPYVLVEAMQYRCAVVSTKVGGVGEVVEHEATGLLVPPSKPTLLADALLALVEQRDLRDRLAHAGHTFITGRFPLDTMVDQTIEVYRHVIEATGPST